MRSPSEDSGVELNGNHVFGADHSHSSISGSIISNGGSRSGVYNSFGLPTITASDEGLGSSEIQYEKTDMDNMKQSR